MVARIEHKFENGIEHKWCGKCKQYKQCTGDNNKFGKGNSKTWDGLRPTCKDCLAHHNSLHKEEKHAYNAAYWAKTKVEQTAKHKIWKQNNKEHYADYMQKYRENNGKRIDKKQWQKRKHDKNYRLYQNEYQKAWCKKQRTENLQYKLKYNISRRIRECLYQKNMSTNTYVGCSMLKLQCHLEKQFDEFMSWSNQGTWHIDHRIPTSAFDLTNPIEQRACFHFLNLQPMWGSDNIRKKDKYEMCDKIKYMKEWYEFCY